MITKKDALQIVIDLNNGLDLTPKQKNQLLCYFSPRIGKPKTPEQWVAKAASKKDARADLMKVYALNSRIVASDGHRIHLADAALPDGIYDPATLVKTGDLNETLPSIIQNALKIIDGLIPHVDDEYPLNMDGDQELIKGNYLLKLDEKRAIDTQYAREALLYTADVYDHGDRFLLTGANCKAIVMLANV